MGKERRMRINRKNFRKKIDRIVVLAILLVVIAGCKKGTETEVGDSKAPTQEKGKVEIQQVQGVPINSIFMKVGNEKVAYSEVLAYIYFLKKTYEPRLGKAIWDFELDEKEKFQDYAKNEIIKNITQIKIINQKAEELEIQLSYEEKNLVSEMAKKYFSSISKEDQEAYALTKESIEQIYMENQLSNKVFNISTNEVDTNITDAQAKQIHIQYLLVMTSGEDKNGNKLNYTEKKLEDSYARAKKLLEEVKDRDDFYNFAQANTDDKVVELTFGEDDMPEEFGGVGLKMKTGEISDIIEADSGYYILHCVSDFDQEATRSKKEEIIYERENKVFQATYKEWSEDFKVILDNEKWSRIEFVN
jgi:foldase protein PrsA